MRRTADTAPRRRATPVLPVVLILWAAVSWLLRLRLYPRRRGVQQRPPGLLMLEIDGLAEPVLRQALDRGYMPTLRRWLDSGSHVITPWECDLSSQTSASQA